MPKLSENQDSILSFLHKHFYPIALLAIIALALSLRLYGINWDNGIAYTPHPDERAILFKVAEISPVKASEFTSLFNANESSWNPHWFAYGSLPIYLIKGIESISEAISSPGIQDLRITGRLVSTIADIVTLITVYILGARLYSRKVALIACGFIALAVLHIQLSHFFAVDTLQAMFAVLTIFFLYRVARFGGLANSILAGLFMGLGLATKASQLPILLAFAVAHVMWLLNLSGDNEHQTYIFQDRLKEVFINTLAGLLTAVGAFFLTQPYAFLDWKQFYSDFTEQSEMVRRIRDYPYTRQYINTQSYLYFIQQHIFWGLGIPLGIIAWSGLLFVAVRGLEFRRAILYGLMGIVVPAGLLIWSSDIKVVIVASALVILSLLVTLPFRQAKNRLDVVILSWVLPYLIITGSLEVKFMRYMIPVTPFLILFGSQMLVSFWHTSLNYFRKIKSEIDIYKYLKIFLILSGVLLTFFSIFYSISYLAIYSKPHTAVRASEWIQANLPKSSVLLKEHWEEGIPNLHGYQIEELPMYDPDVDSKINSISNHLAKADALILYSDRLYGTIPRIPDRYPKSSSYYQLLFSGQLGYHLAHYETAYPNLLGITLIHNSFSRPNLPIPKTFEGFNNGGISVDLGHSDESFSVYDHPTILIFFNSKRYDSNTIRQLIDDNYDTAFSFNEKPLFPSYSQDDLSTQLEGGSHSEIFKENIWTSKYPVITWVILIEGLLLLAFPLTFFVMRSLPDKGFMFSRTIGILIVSIIVWLLASTQWLPFNHVTITLAFAILGLASLIIFIQNKNDICQFLRHRWKLLLVTECLFLLAFFIFLSIRMANPDLWHPFRGGEKPMDLAYLNAIVKSTIMPPYDPWFSGGFLNYYYFGQFMVAMFIKATAIEVRTAYNLAIPLFFALTVAGSFSIGYNLAACAASSGNKIQSVISNRSKFLNPYFSGFIAAVSVAVIGNLDGIIQLISSLVNVTKGLPSKTFDFWQSSRMMPPDPPGFEITEFPFFSFLFADLHAHMIAIPFTLLALVLALALVLNKNHSGKSRVMVLIKESAQNLVILTMLGISIGVLRIINTWDYPTYLIIGAAAVFASNYFRYSTISASMALRSISHFVIVLLIGYVVFIPFHSNYQSFFSNLETTTNTTVLWQFLSINGLFIFILGSFYLNELRNVFASSNSANFGQYNAFQKYLSRLNKNMDFIKYLWMPLILLIIGAVSYGLVVNTGSTVPFLIGMTLIVFAVGIAKIMKREQSYRSEVFVTILSMVALLLAIGLDFYRVEGDIDRMNSVFKIYLQIWVLFAIASSYALWRLVNNYKNVFLSYRASSKILFNPSLILWSLMLVALFASSLIYPILGTRDRINDRFDSSNMSFSLDGMAYMKSSEFTDEIGTLNLRHDYEAIIWLQNNISGSPIIMEGHTPTYRWGNRISIYTGLPTVIGWKWHQEQQRWDYRDEVAERIRDVDVFYSTTEMHTATSIIEKYGVDYVYLGELESLYYPEKGLDKFQSHLDGLLDPIYFGPKVTIYRVKH
tara:strand:+ start:196 stop:4752 length:4557 start_codon:yes stop_codon:yes gene_type:complete